MITGGRCHGPNCTRDATDGPWCAPACKTAWHAQFHWLYGDGKVLEPVIVRELVEPDVVHEDGDRALAAALDAAQPQLEQHLAAVIQAADPPPASTVTVAEVARIAASLPRTGETAKLTEEQFWALTHSFPDRPGWQPNGQPGAFDGVQVEIVETVEESTPYLMAQRPRRLVLNPHVAPEAVEELQRRFRAGLGVQASSFVGVGDMAVSKVVEIERLNARLRTAFPERADEAIAEAWRRAYCSYATYAQAVESMWVDPPEFASSGAAYQQVAPKDPQVGFIGRAFHWLFGRTG